MNDKLSSKEIAELHEIAEWLDSVYTRLDGSIFAFALELGNEEYHRLLQTDIERVIELGISMNRSMENCGCLFEFLNGTERPPIEFILRARSEINNLAIAVRQLAIDEQPSDDPNKIKWIEVKACHIQYHSSTLADHIEKHPCIIRKERNAYYMINEMHIRTYLKPTLKAEVLNSYGL